MTIRLKDREKRLLTRAAKRYGRARARSAMVREAIVGYWTEKLERAKAAPYESVKDKLGCWRGAPADLSERVREGVVKNLHARRARSR